MATPEEIAQYRLLGNTTKMQMSVPVFPPMPDPIKAALQRVSKADLGPAWKDWEMAQEEYRRQWEALLGEAANSVAP
jgi:hypothetical protein